MNHTLSPGEIERFSRLAPRWWDVHGPMRPLHRMNPVRIGWVGAQLAKRFGDRSLPMLDVGCGAGIASEALARLGHDVTGLDASAEALEVARLHAAGEGLVIDYRLGVAADLAAEGRRFRGVVALEVIEHVPDQAGFMDALAALMASDGVLVVSTLNRTLRSLAVAKIGAEYIARMLPAGTHDWRAFVTPGALAARGRGAGLRLAELAGLSYAPLTGDWRIGRDVRMNYIAAFTKA